MKRYHYDMLDMKVAAEDQICIFGSSPVEATSRSELHMQLLHHAENGDLGGEIQRDLYHQMH